MQINDYTTKKIINCAMTVHRYFGSGYLERVYQNAFSHELLINGFTAQTEKSIKVYYHNIIVGYYKADILIDNSIVIEIKYVDKIIFPHIRQVKNYLKSTKLHTGFIFNFNSQMLDFKRIYSN